MSGMNAINTEDITMLIFHVRITVQGSAFVPKSMVFSFNLHKSKSIIDVNWVTSFK